MDARGTGTSVGKYTQEQEKEAILCSGYDYLKIDITDKRNIIMLLVGISIIIICDVYAISTIMMSKNDKQILSQIKNMYV